MSECVSVSVIVTMMNWGGGGGVIGYMIEVCVCAGGGGGGVGGVYELVCVCGVYRVYI